MPGNAELAIVLSARDLASGPLRGIHGALGSLAGAAAAPARALGGIADNAAKLGLGVIGITGLAGAVADLAGGLISGNAQMETYQTQLTTMMGSADAAKERIAQLAKIGAETPFELTQLVASEKILMGFGLTTDKTMKLTGKSLDSFRTSIGDMAAGTGVDLSELTNLWGKFGSGATGEAISRLQELGIVTREQLSDVGIQFSKSGELMSPLPEAMAAAMKIADSKFGGGMAKLSQTFDGQMSTLADNFNQAKVAIMAPIFDVLKESLTGLNSVLSSGAFQGAIAGMADALAGLVKGGIEFVGSAFAALGPTLESFGPLIQIVTDAWATLAQVFAGDWSPSDEVDPLVNLLGQFAIVVRDVVLPGVTALATFLAGTLLLAVNATIAAVNVASAAISAMTAFVSENRGVQIVLAAAVGATTAMLLAAGVQWAVTSATALAHTVIVGAQTLATTAATAAQALFNAMLSANPIGIVVVAVGALVGALVYLYNTNEDARRIIDAAWSGIQGAVNTAWDAIRPALQALGNILDGIAGAARQVQRALDSLHAPSIQLPGFASGGIVPGPLGRPMLAIVHGGETVVPAGRGSAGGGGGGNTFNFYGIGQDNAAGLFERWERSQARLARLGAT